jgi:hypothetical protein
MSVDVNGWWQTHGRVIGHALQGRTFIDDTSEPTNETTKTIKVASTSANQQPSLKEFQEVYSKNATYQDLFIFTTGRQAVRYSFELIGMFWEIHIVQIGPPVSFHRKSSDLVINSGKDDGLTAVVRVPYTIAQRPKGVLSWIGWYQYQGWIDLHIRQEQAKEGQPKWKVEDHDDRIAFHGQKKDVLTTIQGIPVVRTVFHSFRLAHGSVIQYMARTRTKG